MKTAVFSPLKLSISFILIIFSVGLYSQDKIHLKNGDKIDAKVEEVGVKQIKYKKKESPKGPIYIIGKNEIDSVSYENGRTETYSYNKVNPKLYNFKQNIISVNAVPLIYNQLQIDYKRVFKKGKLGFSIPLVLRMDNNTVQNEFEYIVKWMTGAEFVIMPTGQKTFLYNLGIGINTGQLSTKDYISQSLVDPITGVYTSYSYTKLIDHNFIGLSINNSMEYTVKNWLSINLGLNLGINKVFQNRPKDNYDYSNENYRFFARPEIGIGFKF